jgi:carboxyl-terminal processing protease
MLKKVAQNRSVRAFLLTFTVFSGGLAAGHAAMVQAAEGGADPYEGLGTLARAMTQIQVHYVEELSTAQLSQAAIKGMADSLDPRTNYFDPETYRRLRQDTEGNQSGVGVLVNPAEGGGLLVTELVPGGPAELAGVRVGDVVIGVDTHDVRALELTEAVALVRGPRGSAVTLVVQRGGEQLSLDVVRDEILQPSVSAELVQPGVGYLRIEQFRRRSGQEFLDELKRLEAMDGGSLDALVLDLRNNPGGLLEQAVVVVDHFVEEGLIVETQGRSGKASDDRYDATVSDTDGQTRLVVLIDGMSASASEIVAGALQDHGRALLVGQPSYGKGSVQAYFEYEDESALALTIGHYTLPSGRQLHRDTPITPDHLVELPGPEAPVAELRAALEQAQLSEPERAALLEIAERLPAPRAEPGSPVFRGSVRERIDRDPQLARAVELAAGE